MPSLYRYRVAARAAGVHLLFSALVAATAAWLVFSVWYAYPYRDMSGGRELFLLVVSVDVVCGPLLTLVLFSPSKPRKELWLDLSMVAFLQLAALGYGLWSVWVARPLYLVHEVDRYKVIAAPDVNADALSALPSSLKPRFWEGPKMVGIRPAKDAEEHNAVLFAAATGGRDYGARPEFYIPYEGAAALKTLDHVKPLEVFLQKHPDQRAAATVLAQEKNADLTQWFYLPVVARQDWVAVLDRQGGIQGFLRGDGF
ncbi:MAG: TfpX/TfpZ family type IV pilin accessory protein [Rhodoferax sp.]